MAVFKSIIPIADYRTPGFPSLRALVCDEQPLAKREVFGTDQRDLNPETKKQTQTKKEGTNE